MLRSISGVQSAASITQPDFKQYAKNRGNGFQLVDWEMHKDVCNLFYAKYGKADSQGTCGYGSNTNGRVTGLTNEAGMTDTFANPENTAEYTAYIMVNGAKKNIQAPNVLGYENWYGNKGEWINDTFNEGKVDYSMHITMPDGSIRKLKGETVGGDRYPMNVVNGRYMDVWVARAGGSTSSNYFDLNQISVSINRVVVRSGDYANASGGVAFANTSYDSSVAVAFVGSRLAFRGKIVIAKSVAAFKAVIEIA